MEVGWVGEEQFCWCSLGCSPRHCPSPAGQGFFWSCAWKKVWWDFDRAEFYLPILSKNIHSGDSNLTFCGVVYHRYEELIIFMVLKVCVCKIGFCTNIYLLYKIDWTYVNFYSRWKKYGQDCWLAPIQGGAWKLPYQPQSLLQHLPPVPLSPASNAVYYPDYPDWKQ